jgi:hypothetical protein
MLKKHFHKNLSTITAVVVGSITLLATVSVLVSFDTISNWIGFASGKSANIIIDTKGIIGKTPTTWSNFAQGGESPDYSFAPIVPQLQTLKPQYIRIDHLYDYYVEVSRDSNNQLSYDWTKLDRTLVDISEAGAKPFIALTYMPLAISRGDIIDAPQDWNLWSQVVQKTIEHISGKSQLNLEDVYYEVWNEPDLFGSWKTYGDKNYLTLYQFAEKGAQLAQQTNNFKIGGPSTTKLYPNWIHNFLKFTKENQLRLDFYSWHLYSAQVSDYQESIAQYDKEVRQYKDYIFKLEPIITEWGFDSNNHPGYDSNFAAAHSIAVLSTIYPKIPKAFSFEVQDGLDPAGGEHWGRWGMLTHQQFGSKPKPRFIVHQWLSNIGTDLLSVTGQGDWVRAIATKDQNTIIIIISNYDPKSTHTETFPLSLKRLENNSYTYSQELLGHGATQKTINITDQNYLTSLTLPPNSVMKITLTPN